MKKIVLIVSILGALVLNAKTLIVSKDDSNSYFRAMSDFFVFGRDEIVGINKEVNGFVIYENNKIKNGTITISSSSFDTQNGKRDQHISDILNASKEPGISFFIEEEIEDTNGKALKGTLEINGVKRPLVIPVKISSNKNLIIEGKFSVNYEDFGIETPSFGGIIKNADDTIELGGKFIFIEG